MNDRIRSRAVRDVSQVEEAADVSAGRDICGMSLSESQRTVDIDVDLLAARDLDLIVFSSGKDAEVELTYIQCTESSDNDSLSSDIWAIRIDDRGAVG